MNRFLLAASLLCASFVQLTSAQQPPAPQEEKAQALILEIRTQQAAMVENQAKIEAQLARLNELIRQARIYSSRSGS